MRHMLQHEPGTSEEQKMKIKGEEDSSGNYVVVEVINEDVEYDDEEYELDTQEMVEEDGTETFKLADDDNDAFVTGLEFEGDEVTMKN